jgi:hypothetical protein
MKLQMIRVISSPLRSTTGFFTLIFGIDIFLEGRRARWANNGRLAGLKQAPHDNGRAPARQVRESHNRPAQGSNATRLLTGARQRWSNGKFIRFCKRLTRSLPKVYNTENLAGIDIDEFQLDREFAYFIGKTMLHLAYLAIRATRGTSPQTYPRI